MSPFVSLVADLLVAILLVATITTSLRLSRRMSGLKADEAAMRATIADLMVATDSAERAIAGLRATVSESDRTLAERLAAASHHSSRLAEHVSAGESVISRVVQMAGMSQQLGQAEPPKEAAQSRPMAPPSSGSQGLRATMQAAREVAARAARQRGNRAA